MSGREAEQHDSASPAHHGDLDERKPHSKMLRRHEFDEAAEGLSSRATLGPHRGNRYCFVECPVYLDAVPGPMVQ